MTRIINLFAGPGSGKSTTATGVFSLLKMHDINCEYVPEHAKDLAWEKTLTVFYDQYWILGEQHRRQARLDEQVDVMITDSPILQQCAYVNEQHYEDLCVELFSKQDNKNYFIRRLKQFNAKGRKENLEQAKQVDDRIHSLLTSYDFPFKELQGKVSTVNTIVEDYLKSIDRKMEYNIV